MTIPHKFGETTIDTPPARVFVARLREQDSLFALGVVPVATTKMDYAASVSGAGVLTRSRNHTSEPARPQTSR